MYHSTSLNVLNSNSVCALCSSPYSRLLFWGVTRNILHLEDLMDSALSLVEAKWAVDYVSDTKSGKNTALQAAEHSFADGLAVLEQTRESFESNMKR